MQTLLANPLPWLLAVHLPMLAAVALVSPVCRPAVRAVAAWTAAPALVLAFVAQPGTVVHVPWMLFDARFGIDATGRVFLFFTVLLWLIAGIYAHIYHAHDAARDRFLGFFLVTMSGNVGLILAADAVSFYLYFALMSFASYGLIVHHGDEESRRAGRVYIVLVVVGEIMLFAGILLVANQANTLDLSRLAGSLEATTRTTIAAALLLVGFGIKAGALPLHVWLPLAHPAAPTAASAVLSGTMIKAGLLGWIRFLPLGKLSLPELGWICLIIGLVAAFFGVAMGLAQRNAKTTLAYSSISQMGMMNVGVGAALVVPEVYPAALAALWLYALHHALAKGSLFLGVGVAAAAGFHRWKRGLVIVGLLLPGVALAGAPLTSGAVAKSALARVLVLAEIPGFAVFESLLSLAAVGTTLLIARFLFLVLPQRNRPATQHSFMGLGAAWLLSLIAVASAVWLLPWGEFDVPYQRTSLRYAIVSLWPIAVGAGIASIVWIISRTRLMPHWPEIPAGDMLIPIVGLLGGVQRVWNNWTKAGRSQIAERLLRHTQQAWATADVHRRVEWMHEVLSTWSAVGILFVSLWFLLFALLLLG